MVRILPIQVHCLFAFGACRVPLLQREEHAASQVVGFSRTRLCLWKRPQNLQRLVCLAGLQSCVGVDQFVLRGLCPREHGHSRCQQDEREPSHRTTLMGICCCKGCPLVVPVATQSPTFSPEMMETWVRLVLPLTTGVLFNSLPTTRKTKGLPFSMYNASRGMLSTFGSLEVVTVTVTLVSGSNSPSTSSIFTRTSDHTSELQSRQ